MSLRSLGDAKRAAKACCTILEASAGELTVNELHVLAIRRKAALELLHALARDCHATRERLKAEAEVAP